MTIENVLLNTSETTILTGTTNGLANVCLMFCNTSAANVVITVYLKKPSQGAGDVNTIIKNLSLPATDTFIFNLEKVLMQQNAVLTAIASTANVVSVSASYLSF